MYLILRESELVALKLPDDSFFVGVLGALTKEFRHNLTIVIKMCSQCYSYHRGTCIFKG